jgi:hypothetical protein
MMQDNSRIKQRDIALKLGISQERAHHIVETNYRKVCARWAPRQFTDPMKKHRKTVVKNFLTDVVSKGTISSRILPMETNPGFIMMTWKTKGNPRNMISQVLRV